MIDYIEFKLLDNKLSLKVKSKLNIDPFIMDFNMKIKKILLN